MDRSLELGADDVDRNEQKRERGVGVVYADIYVHLQAVKWIISKEK